MTQALQFSTFMTAAAGDRTAWQRHGAADGRRDRAARRVAAAVNSWPASSSCFWLALALLFVPPGGIELFGGSFVVDDFARFLKLLILVGSARRADAVARLSHRRKAAEIRIRRADSARDARHDDADFGRRSDRALYRARTDEPCALRAGRLQPRQPAIDRSGPEIFRPGRAVVRHAALRRLADLRLHRHGEFRRHRQGVPRRAQHRAHLRHGVSVRRLLLQGFRGAVPHVDARRL